MNRIINKRLLILFVVGTFALSLTLVILVGGVFGEVRAQDESQYKIGFIVKTMSNPYFARMKDGAEQAVEDFNIELDWVSAEKHTDIAGQLRLVEDMLQKDIDAIVINPSGPKAIVPAIGKANEKGIPVVIVDTRAEGGDTVTFVGLDNEKAAEKMAHYVADYLNEKGKIAILEGVRGHSTAEERLTGYYNVLDEYPNIEVVAAQAADWDRSKGMSVTENILQSNPGLDFIISSNDEMAAGAIRAIRANGKMGEIKVVGFDATKEALEDIKDGYLLATVESVPDKQAYVSIEAAIDYLDGKEVDSEISVPVTIVDKENVDEVLENR